MLLALFCSFLCYSCATVEPAEVTEAPSTSTVVTEPISDTEPVTQAPIDEPAKTVEYTLINSKTINGTSKKGTADGTKVKDAIIKLNESVVLPLYEGAEWSISVKGTLLDGGSGGCQFFANTDQLNGKVYLGANKSNAVVYIGVAINTTSANYCWSVPADVMSSEHEYVFAFKDGEFSLTVDNEAYKLSRYNVNQANTVLVGSKKASAELYTKIRAITGTDHLVMSYIGTQSHPCTSSFEYFNVSTSDTSGYDSTQKHFLAGKNIFFLGSSVTRGHGGNTDGTSFAEMTAALAKCLYQKKAVSGTCLAITDGSTSSYVERFDSFAFSRTPDALVVQLSTNDFKKPVPVGKLAEGKSLAELDPKTITGALETIVAKALEKNPDIKVIIYTCPLATSWSKYAEYKEYITRYLYPLQEKWSDCVYILDLFNADCIENKAYLQSDGLHPQKEGYAQLFTPYFIKLLEEIYK